MILRAPCWALVGGLLVGVLDSRPAMADESTAGDLEARRLAAIGALSGVVERFHFLATRSLPTGSDLFHGWWRPFAESRRGGATIPAGTDDLSRARVAWLAGGGDAPYPVAPDGKDPEPVLTALILDRQLRESRGVRGYPEASPLAALRVDPNLKPTVDWFLRDVLAPAYSGPTPELREFSPETSPEWIAAAKEKAATTSAALSRNRWIALAVTVVFLGLAAWFARRVGTVSPGA